ncbi:MAG: hypothetical protein KAS72_10995 [Phycisphaerales bacterium]|nr:hypothetical protein [Phycisphaerales bacterium]
MTRCEIGTLMLRRSAVVAIAATCMFAAQVGDVCADQILEIDSDTLTQNLCALPTTVQDVRATHGQRGVSLDGSLRARATHPWALAGNPGVWPWNGKMNAGGLRLDMGAYSFTDVDLAFAANVPWLIGRSYNALQEYDSSHYDSDGYQGNNWFQMSQPEIMLYEGDTDDEDVVYLIYGADRFIEFRRHDVNSVEFKAKNGAAGVMQYVAGSGNEPDTYTYTDPHGMVTVFFGFDGDANPAEGQIWKVTDAAGNTAYAGDEDTASTAISDGYDGSGRIDETYDSAGRRFSYTYTTLNGTDRLTEVKAEIDDGGWTEVGKVQYGYYGSGQPAGTTYGSTGDLATVTITIPLTDSGINDVRVQYYRYWSGTYNATTNPGHDHGLQYVVDFEGTRNFDWSDSTFDADYLTATEESLKPYSSAYFEYNSAHEVNEAYFNGACGCSGAGNGTFEYTYAANGSYSDGSGYDQTWAFRVITKRPDGAYETQYFDETHQPISHVLTDDDPANTDPAPDFWAMQVVRNSSGIITEIHTPANVTGYTHSSASFTASASVGLVRTFDLVSSGDMTGFITNHRHRTGTSGTSYYDIELAYTSASLTVGNVSITRAMVDERTVNANFISNPHAGQADFELTPTYNTGGTAVLTYKDVETENVAVSAAKNGSGSATTTTRYTRKDGTTAFVESTEGHHDYMQYDEGLPVKRIVDCQTNHGSDFASGDDPNTDFDIDESGDGERVIIEYAHDDQGRTTTTTLPDGTVTLSYYTALADRRLVVLRYPKYVSGTGTYYGPVSYTVTNHAGKVEASGIIAFSGGSTTTAITSHIDETDSDAVLAVNTGTLSRLATSSYNEAGTTLDASRTYFDTPSSLPGTDGTHYDQTTYGYDDSGRRWRVKTAVGTITRTVFDDISRPIETHIGTNDSSFDGGESSGTDDMVKVSAIEYDSGSDGGNSYITTRTRYVQDSDTDKRETTYTNNERGRAVLVTNEEPPHILTKYDNRGRVIAVGQYSSAGGLSASSDPTTVTTNRIGLVENDHDQLGRVWETTRHKIDDADGSDDDTLVTETWFDAAGRLIKQDGEQLVKYAYDRLGRRTHQFVLAVDNDSVYADADDVTGDIVLTEMQTTYESSDSSLVLMTARIDRLFDDKDGGETTGALDTNADGDVLQYTAANIEGRIQINAMWYDTLNRVTTVARYGTNHATDNVGTFDRDGLSAPSRSDTVLVATYAYNDDGTRLSVTDPMNIETRTTYDDVGRVTKVVANYTDGTPGGGTNDDEDQTIAYEYTDGLKTKVTADLPAGQTDQETTYTYGVTASDSPGPSEFAAGHLLRSVQYPDSGGGTDLVTFAYNALSQQIYAKDQAGNIIEMDYDDLGRIEHRRVTTLANGFDGAVRRITWDYTDRGQVETATQYDNATVGSGSVVDEVKYTFDDWGGVTNFQQDHNSTVATGGDYLYDVQWTYAKATAGRNTLRISTMTLPDGDVISYGYLSSSGLHDADASRVTSVVNGGTTLAWYRYNGVGHVVSTYYEEPDVKRYMHAGSSAFEAFDRFNRVIIDRWTKDLATDVDFCDRDISYDRNGNITVIDDNVHYGWDVEHSMDDLNRVIQAERGEWTGSSITRTTEDELWDLSQTGNWGIHQLDLNGDGDFTDANELDDDGTFNAANELTARDIDDDGNDDYTLVYDAVGNLTDDGENYEYEYDAFGRIVEITDQSQNTVAEYAYNGLGHRITVHYDTDGDSDVDANDATYHHVYDTRWRIVATFRNDDDDPKEQFTHHNAGLSGRGGSSYIDMIICRDKDANTDWDAEADGTLEERVYYFHNYRGDVAALLTDDGKMLEWVQYSSYGVPFGQPAGDIDSDGDCDASDAMAIAVIIMAEGYDVRADLDLDGDVDAADQSLLTGTFLGVTLGRGALSNPDVQNFFGYTGHRHDEAVDVILHARHRVLLTELGRWTRRDPLGYVDGMGLYGYVQGGPTTKVDPYGTEAGACTGECGVPFVKGSSTYGEVVFSVSGICSPAEWTYLDSLIDQMRARLITETVSVAIFTWAFNQCLEQANCVCPLNATNFTDPAVSDPCGTPFQWVVETVITLKVGEMCYGHYSMTSTLHIQLYCADCVVPKSDGAGQAPGAGSPPSPVDVKPLTGII